MDTFVLYYIYAAQLNVMMKSLNKRQAQQRSGTKKSKWEKVNL